jgi:hypothetical protein
MKIFKYFIYCFTFEIILSILYIVSSYIYFLDWILGFVLAVIKEMQFAIIHTSKKGLCVSRQFFVGWLIRYSFMAEITPHLMSLYKEIYD